MTTTITTVLTVPGRPMASQTPPFSNSSLLELVAHRPLHLAHSIWLFTYSDLKTIVATSLGFGFFTAAGAIAFGLDPLPTWFEYVSGLLTVLMWAWLNLLPFTIDNQRQPASILEDSLNKPWRPMPSKRMTPEQARSLMLLLYGAAVGVSALIGGLCQCLVLIGLGYWYNQKQGSDAGFLVRNLINSLGFMSYIAGAAQLTLGPQRWTTFIALGRGMSIGPTWLAIIGAVVMSTVQTQDMCDQLGDRARGRKTLPLVIGDVAARWVTAVTISMWGPFCVWFWGWRGWVENGHTKGSFARCAVGAAIAGLAWVIAFRTLVMRSGPNDHTTFKLWNLWLVGLYALPLLVGADENGKSH
ncbi:hypothetical protein ASPACDRAFT_116526 [Aspergillus aculeatus ATCC 16872]|uniref:Uncharacterized protein n=1 Tax=Aspergillus aculeatus (strain ATCC 16872 / CBS 172.66 / WB 5094) TaxID=690307 RepID=A0A1L9WZR2_ASPA1|nr:uncharacterized protein ASPACDRAFT_116526 [Aspergillus aculeatus ATCC 16872]OJK01624.1 hypothetical protein ASPACDRAFT_116526 [Aspergillus aculeatus ATCC 16872]